MYGRDLRSVSDLGDGRWDDVSGYTVTYLTILELIDRRIKREWMETVGMRALS